jgi:hypothetical protein
MVLTQNVESAALTQPRLPRVFLNLSTLQGGAIDRSDPDSHLSGDPLPAQGDYSQPLPRSVAILFMCASAKHSPPKIACRDREASALELLLNSEQPFGRFSTHFTCAVRSRIHRKEARNCTTQVADGWG